MNYYILLSYIHSTPSFDLAGIIATIIIGSLIIGYIFWANRGVKNANDYCDSILAILLRMGHYSKNTKNLLVNFHRKLYAGNKSYLTTEMEAESFSQKIIRKSKLVNPEQEIDYDIIIKKKDLSFRCSLVRLMFKLAAEVDGIKNDEWNYILNAMSRLKINKRSYDYFIKYYSPLRTEFDESEFFNEETKQEYSAPSSPSLIQQYYDILGVSVGASKQEIQKAYHALALIHHPDMQQNADRKEECETKMAQINDAYERVIASL